MPPPAPRGTISPVEALPTAVTGFVGAAGEGPVDSPVTVRSAAAYHAVFGPSLDAGRPLGHAVDLFFAGGGTQAVVVRAAGPAPEQLVPTEGPGGLHALDHSGITVLVVPGLTTDHPEQVRVALARCAAYRAVLLLDLPPGPWTSDVGRRLDEVDEHRERAAAYHPWVVVDGLAVPPSGAVAGVVARTDAQRGVWKAPAGVELRGIDGFTEALDRTRTDELTDAGVSALREFPGRGRLVWGARTLAGAQTGDPAARYLSVRRLTDHVLASLTAGLAVVADRPSDAALWADVRRRTEQFLHALWLQGAFAGSKVDEAYGARCGPGQTMTEVDVRAGRVVLSFWMAPLRPAEFDVHTVTLQAAVPPTGLGQVGRDRVDLGRVVSRYLGETEKNLGRVLDGAQRPGPVLGFDEADALFGRRARRAGSTDEADALFGRRADGSPTDDSGAHDPSEEPEPR
ncbi:phage tail sheath subtilisin-like domain-containing protein [uncultured Serinicoccus sp.]|uniref:phage tail sheath family protein n=1 Tax=uncultured Serinicoccus sp. TaxID=735514 RepID=UPI00260252D2|nr:phage tail sheath subtilisin-like domain-containing protein [uncultured Serinicoccus sp.]